ncbi:MAG TPA: PAS domain S-box protein, partial [Kofleriaceae bacterium]
AQVERGVLSIAIAPDAGGIVARQLLAGLVAFPPIAIVVFLGARMGWYALSIASALMVFLTLAEASVFLLATAKRLSRFDAEQRRVTSELRMSEARVRSLVEQAKDGIFLADVDGRYLDVNPAGCAMLGYTRDEIVAKTFADLLHPADMPKLERERAGMISGGTSRNEWKLRRRDGSYVEVEIVGNMLSDGRLQGFVRDITGRKQIERQLAEAFEAERELRADLEAVDIARTVVADAVAALQNAQIDDVLTLIAEQARKLTGAEYSAVGIGTDPTRQFDHWITAGMSDDVVRAIGRIPRPIGLLGHVVERVEPLRVRDAATHPSSIGLPPHHPPMHSFLAMPIRRGGNVIGNIYLANKRHAAEFSDRDERLVALLADGIARAIEQARSFAAEVRLRTWLRSVVDQLPEGVIVIDTHAHVQAINQVMREWAAEPHAIVRDVGGNPRQFDVRDVHGATVEFEQLPVIRALRTGESTDGVELLLRQRDGQLLPIEARAAPIRDEAGAIAGAVVVVHDVSERKHIERLREEWLAVIAHDLRQPVSAIVAATGLLIDHIAPDREPEILNGLRDAAFRMNRMVSDLLDAGRIASNQLALQCRPIELVGVVAHSIEQLRLASPDVEVVIDAPREQVAWGDPQRLEQVLANLLSNAVKYRTPDTAIRVEVGHEQDAARVCVCNEGPPIAPQEQSKLFMRFARTRGAIAEHKPGVGLGLYICKGLVEAHGGRIWVESRSGWTKFSFTVPAQDRCRP